MDDIKPTHDAEVRWRNVQQGVYTVGYALLEAMFNYESNKRNLIADNEWAKIVHVDADDQYGELTLGIEIYKRQDN